MAAKIKSGSPISLSGKSEKYNIGGGGGDQKLGLFSTVALGFFWISGGFYCAEPIVQTGPIGYVFIIMLSGAFLFGLPLAFISAESATMYPENGGYIQTIRVACGETIGIHVAYWMSIMECVDAVSYPVLAATILHKYFPYTDPFISKLCLGFPIIIGITLINLKGTYFMSQASTVIFLTCLVPCIIFIACGIRYIDWMNAFNFSATISSTDDDSGEGSGTGFNYAYGLSVVMWLYSGAINLGVLAGEVRNPYTTFLTASLILIPLVATVNLLPVLISTSIDNNTAHYQVGYYQVISRYIAGQWFAVVYDIGTVVALIGLYNSATVVAQEGLAYLIESSRNPFQQILESYDAMQEEENELATKKPGYLNVKVKWWERLLFAYPRRRHHIVRPLKMSTKHIMPLHVMFANPSHIDSRTHESTPSIEDTHVQSLEMVIDDQNHDTSDMEDIKNIPLATIQRSSSTPVRPFVTFNETNSENYATIGHERTNLNPVDIPPITPVIHSVPFQHDVTSVEDSSFSSNDPISPKKHNLRPIILSCASEPMPTEETRRNQKTRSVNIVEQLQDNINHVADIMAQRRIYVLLNLIVATIVFFMADFELLIEVDMIIASANTICMVLSFLWVRKNRPEEHRPFKIPGGIFGCVFCSVCPLIFIMMYLYLSLSEPTNRFIRIILFCIMVSFGLFMHLIWKIFRHILQANVQNLNRKVTNYGTMY